MIRESERLVSRQYRFHKSASSGLAQRTNPPQPAVSKAVAIALPAPLVFPEPVDPKAAVPSQASRIVQESFGPNHKRGVSNPASDVADDVRAGGDEREFSNHWKNSFIGVPSSFLAQVRRRARVPVPAWHPLPAPSPVFRIFGKVGCLLGGVPMSSVFGQNCLQTLDLPGQAGHLKFQGLAALRSIVELLG